MNKLLPIDHELEILLRDSLKLDNVQSSPDSDFLAALQRRLETIPPPPLGVREEPRVGAQPPWRTPWRAGVMNGITGIAVGLILLLGLNTLPGFFVKMSIAGSGLAQQKLVTLTIQQQVIWNQFVVNFENQTRVYLQR